MTIPHKARDADINVNLPNLNFEESIKAYMDELTDAASTIGAINTVTWSSWQMHVPVGDVNGVCTV